MLLRALVPCLVSLALASVDSAQERGRPRGPAPHGPTLERAGRGVVAPLGNPPGEGPGTVWAHYEIDAEEPALVGAFEPFDFLGVVARLGDLNGDGTTDVAVGVPTDNDGGGPFSNRGAVWILFLEPDGSVASFQKISATEGGFTGDLDANDNFGLSVASPGDLDGDGVRDLVVGAPGDDDGPSTGTMETDRGALWVLFLRTDGTVARHQKISMEHGGFTGSLASFGGFGLALGALGDLGGDGSIEIAGSARQNGFFILTLTADGTVERHVQVATDIPELPGLGVPAIAPLGDLNHDGVPDVAIGALYGPPFTRAVVILFLAADGSIAAHQEIRPSVGGLDYMAQPGDLFGASLANLGDVDGDGLPELVVGANLNTSSIWVLFLRSDGTVRDFRLIGDGMGGLEVHPADGFGASLAGLGDVNGDGVPDLAVGEPGVNTVHEGAGAMLVLFLDGLAELDFEGPENGSALAGHPSVPALLTLNASGPNYGAAIFDSTPGGPNDPGQDPDLIVDRGNLAILQEDPTSSSPGIFDHPDDSRFGGTFFFEFETPVEVHSVDLADVCPDANQDATVTLVDLNGGLRIFLVPAGWTSDVTVEGTGVGTLDLTTLAPQAGHAAVASASETRGFEPRSVLRLQVTFSSSGAVDDLVYDPHPPGDEEEATRDRIRRRP